jgi:hypothetical protein
MATIADFAAYPSWATGMRRAEVRSVGAGGRAEQVFFELDLPPIKDAYTLAYRWKGDEEVSWTLVEGRLLRRLDGAYVLRDLGGRTEVTYRLALDLTMPLIGALRRKGEKILIETALMGLKNAVEQRGVGA